MDTGGDKLPLPPVDKDFHPVLLASLVCFRCFAIVANKRPFAHRHALSGERFQDRLSELYCYLI
ncbi:hypothetical protein ACTHQ8_03430 [Lysinibacillus odysseyi]|uniref:hypothetical protein n=1 Tax=Lysinibacillus odysseyi TaxID=202611 RepID=UPI000B054687|nr:hypothetical protein [Lysinibacillus odysseyi]